MTDDPDYIDPHDLDRTFGALGQRSVADLDRDVVDAALIVAGHPLEGLRLRIEHESRRRFRDRDGQRRAEEVPRLDPTEEGLTGNGPRPKRHVHEQALLVGDRPPSRSSSLATLVRVPSPQSISATNASITPSSATLPVRTTVSRGVVVDNRKALITSANFTDRGQTRNIEAGVLIEDAEFSRKLSAQWRTLVSHRLVQHYLG